MFTQSTHISYHTEASVKTEVGCTLTYLAPLKRVINESSVVTHNPIRPGTALGGINTEAAEA